MTDQLAQLLGSATTGGLVTWVVQYLLNKRAYKTDIEQKANQMLTEYATKINEQLDSTEHELKELKGRTDKLVENNMILKVQNRLYSEHLHRCGLCDQTKLIKIDNPAEN